MFAWPVTPRGGVLGGDTIVLVDALSVPFGPRYVLGYLRWNQSTSQLFVVEALDESLDFFFRVLGCHPDMRLNL